MRTVHVVPLRDGIEHLVPGGIEDYGDALSPWLMIEADADSLEVDCPCGPKVEHVPPGGWLISHHSIDGRESKE